MNQYRRDENEFALLISRAMRLHPKMPAALVRRDAAPCPASGSG